jgi:hypothetical protein
MTKQDRQVYEAVKLRQAERQVAAERGVWKYQDGADAQADVDYCLELIATLKKEVDRLEKVRR